MGGGIWYELPQHLLVCGSTLDVAGLDWSQQQQVLVVPLVWDVPVVVGPLVARLVGLLQAVELLRLVGVILLEEGLLHQELVQPRLRVIVLLVEEVQALLVALYGNIWWLSSLSSLWLLLSFLDLPTQLLLTFAEGSQCRDHIYLEKHEKVRNECLDFRVEQHKRSQILTIDAM